MTRYNIEQAQAQLPELVRRAATGERVFIEQGAEVVELRPSDKPSVPDKPAPGQDFNEWLKQRRESRPPLGMSSIELLDETDNRTPTSKLSQEERRLLYDWIDQRRNARPAVSIGIVELLDLMYEGEEG